jgi:hypothetical protein
MEIREGRRITMMLGAQAVGTTHRSTVFIIVRKQNRDKESNKRK